MNETKLSDSQLNLRKFSNKQSNLGLLIDQQTKKHNVFKRRYVTRLFWVVTLILSFIIFVSIDSFIALIITCSLVGLASLFNLLMLYISPKKQDFSIDAYITIIVSYIIAWVKLIIIPLDLSASISSTNIEKNAISMNNFSNISANNSIYGNTSISANYSSSIDSEGLHQSISITWNILYWTSIVLNFTIMRFQIAYWSQGHPTISQKITSTLKVLLKQVILVSVVSLSVILILVIKYGSFNHVFNILKSTIQIVNSIYCLCHLVYLFGYGLVQLPFYFYSYTLSYVKVKLNLVNLSKIRDEFEEGVNKLIKDKALILEYCTKLLKFERQMPDENINTLLFAGKIIQQSADYTFVTNELIQPKSVEGNIKDPQITDVLMNLNDDILAKFFSSLKNDYYFCCKKEAALLRVYSIIASNCHIVAECEKILNIKFNNTDTSFSYNKRNSLVINQSHSFNTNKKIACIVPKNHHMFTKIVTKSFALLLILISCVFLGFQINLLFLPSFNSIYFISYKLLKKNFLLNYFFLVFYFVYFFICCFYSLAKFKIFEIYILVPHHTNKYGMANNAAMSNTLILGICYNILYFYSFIYDSKSLETSHSSLMVFFNTMKEVTLIYQNYIYIFPGSLILVVVISLLWRFKLCCLRNRKVKELEIDLDAETDEGFQEVIEENVKDSQGKVIKFELLEKIHKIYFESTEDEL